MEPHYLDGEKRQELPSLLTGLARSGYAVIFLLEDLYLKHKSLVDELNEQNSVAIIPIPGLQGSQGVGIKSITDSVERAVGMDIFSVQK